MCSSIPTSKKNNNNGSILCQSYLWWNMFWKISPLKGFPACKDHQGTMQKLIFNIRVGLCGIIMVPLRMSKSPRLSAASPTTATGCSTIFGVAATGWEEVMIGLWNQVYRNWMNAKHSPRKFREVKFFLRLLVNLCKRSSSSSQLFVGSNLWQLNWF